MTLVEFIKQYYDVPNTGDTPQNQGQCVGLVEQWIDSLSLPHVWGNAKDLLANADPNSYDVIYNTPDGIPSFGDIFVFGSNYGGGVGHTGIVVAASANIVSLFEQNDGINGGTPQFKTYTYGSTNDALGWLHPKGVVVDDQSLISALAAQRDNNWNLHLADQQTIQELQTKLTDLQKQLTECQSVQPSPVVNPTPQVVNPVVNTGEAVTPTEIPVEVTTNDQSTVVNVSTQPSEAPSSSQEQQMPIEQPKPSPLPTPTKPQMDWYSTIVYLIKNIISTLKRYGSRK